MIDEQFVGSHNVVGIAVNIRRRVDRLNVWTRSAEREYRQQDIRRELKKLLQIRELKIHFTSNADLRKLAHEENWFWSTHKGNVQL